MLSMEAEGPRCLHAFRFYDTEREKNSMKNSTICLIGAVILGVWFLLPDPVPLVADDIFAALGSAAAVILYYRNKRIE